MNLLLKDIGIFLIIFGLIMQCIMIVTTANSKICLKFKYKIFIDEYGNIVRIKTIMTPFSFLITSGILISTLNFGIDIISCLFISIIFFFMDSDYMSYVFMNRIATKLLQFHSLKDMVVYMMVIKKIKIKSNKVNS